MAIKTAAELAAAAKNVAQNYKTLYVMGCFGAPMTETNKTRYLKHHSYNSRYDREPKINAATADTFGFDCVCLIKGLLWGWNGDASKIYGGAYYASNGVPDLGADQMIQVCTDVSEDFSTIQVGEVVWMPGHIGVYIGDGLAVECTPIWKDGVQITAVKNIGEKSGYNDREWRQHGKLPYVTYEEALVEEPSQENRIIYSVQLPAFDRKEIAERLLADLKDKGFVGHIVEIPLEVSHEPIPEPEPNLEPEPAPEPEPEPKKTVSEIADEVIQGKWGSGTERVNRLQSAGYDYEAVQAEVNRILLGS